MIKKTYPIAENLLNNGLELSLQLLNLLKKETEILRKATDLSTLSNIVINKKEIVSQLDHFSKQLAQILATEQLPLTPEGVLDYCNKANAVDLNTSSLNILWKKLISTTEQSRLLNEKNGASINILAQHTQRTLHILKGNPRRVTMYGSDGSLHNEQATHALISV